MAKDFQCAQDSETESAAGAENRWPVEVEEARPTGGETILLVEDEGFVRQVVSEVLRSAGYLVLTVKNAAEAVRAYDACDGRVELLLTDVVLPGETGHKLAARLRQENSALKILFITGYAEQMALHSAGREAWLAKPFSTGALLRAVRERIDRQGFNLEDGLKFDQATPGAKMGARRPQGEARAEAETRSA